MLPHLCAATRARGTRRSLLREKKKQKKHRERQSVSQTDRQTQCTLFPPWDGGQAETPVRSPLQLSRVTFTLRQRECRLMPNNRPNISKVASGFGFTIAAHTPCSGGTAGPVFSVFLQSSSLKQLKTREEQKGLRTCPSKISPPSLPPCLPADPPAAPAQLRVHVVHKFNQLLP